MSNQFFCFEVFNIRKFKMATEINIIEINKLKLLTCILSNPHANIMTVVNTIINQ